MFGVSYLGATQWLTASERPPPPAGNRPTQAPIRADNGLVSRGGAFELGMDLYWHLGQSAEEATRRLTRGASSNEQADFIRGLARAFDRLSAGGYADLPLGRPALPAGAWPG